ncbi:MAG: hypothetical protein JXX29_08895 [Deltaproteobacteria bacterium]|nr:hypothetical protein [Deltaproteobacteria bacterium]MBN2671778.1 hypothetical protein [Deltaproteobacteria bacterium]
MSPENKKRMIFLVLSGVIVACVGTLWLGMAGRTADEQSSSTVASKSVPPEQKNSASPMPAREPDSAPKRLSTDGHDGVDSNDAQKVIEQARFMDNLRKTWPKQPGQILPLALQGEQLFADTPLASECAWIAVRCLIEMGRFPDAREKSRKMVEQYPDSDWTMDVKRHLLTHPLDS